MAVGQNKDEFLADLTALVECHCDQVRTLYLPKPEGQLNWQPSPKEWSVLQCFDHLNKTNDFYMPRIKRALSHSHLEAGGSGYYKPSFWAGIYMRFAFNPRLSFPAPGNVVPASQVKTIALVDYLAFQEHLQSIMRGLAKVNLVETRARLLMGITFNLGDYLNVIVKHDELHMGQANRVLASMRRTGV